MRREEKKGNGFLKKVSASIVVSTSVSISNLNFEKAPTKLQPPQKRTIEALSLKCTFHSSLHQMK